MGSRTAIIVAVPVIAAVGLYLAFIFLGGRTRTIEHILRSYQFTELNPPSTLSPPGTLVTVIKDDPLVVGVICTSSDALGDQLQASLLVSDSSSSKEAEQLTGKFNLAENGTAHMSGVVDSKYVKSISLTLSNVRLIEIPDSAVFELVGQRKDSCTEAVRLREQNRQRVSMIKSVIEANARYRVEFEGSLDTTTRTRISSQIASGMGLKMTAGSEDTIQGDGLYWGVRDDESLAAVSQSEPPRTGALEHFRLLPADRSASVMQDGEPK
jgi:hypothetical protein